MIKIVGGPLPSASKAVGEGMPGGVRTIGLNAAVMEMIRIVKRLQRNSQMIAGDGCRSVHDCPRAAKIGGHYDPKKRRGRQELLCD